MSLCRYTVLGRLENPEKGVESVRILWVILPPIGIPKRELKGTPLPLAMRPHGPNPEKGVESQCFSEQY